MFKSLPQTTVPIYILHKCITVHEKLKLMSDDPVFSAISSFVFQINPDNFQVTEEEIGSVQQILNQENNTHGKSFFLLQKGTSTDYGHTMDKSLSLSGPNSNPNPK